MTEGIFCIYYTKNYYHLTEEEQNKLISEFDTFKELLHYVIKHRGYRITYIRLSYDFTLQVNAIKTTDKQTVDQNLEIIV